MVWVLIQIKNNNNLLCNFKIVVVKNTKNFDNILFNIDKILINSQILDVTFFFVFVFFLATDIICQIICQISVCFSYLFNTLVTKEERKRQRQTRTNNAYQPRPVKNTIPPNTALNYG